MKYLVVLGPIAADTVFQTGSTIELSDSDAEPLLHLGVIVEKAEEAEIKKPETQKPTKPEA
jgi:hypothetical protein